MENIKNNTKEEPIVDDKDPEPIVVDPEVALINRCTTKDLASDASCAPIVADHPCIRDPFGGACDITFTDYYKTAQANRISFCRENPTNNLCTGAIKNICDKTPFDADLCFSNNAYHQTHESMCEADPTAPHCETTVSRICKGNVFHGFCYDTPLYESARIDDCIIGGNAGLARCTGAFTAEHCALNPFSVNCDNENYISTARDNRVNFCKSASGSDGICASFTACEANPYGAGCGTHFDYKKVPTAKSWLQSFNEPLPKVPNTVNPKNEFLQGTETGLDFGEAQGYNGNDPIVTTLTLGRDSADGIAFFSGGIGDESYHYHYVGILSNTDLGNARTETTGTAEWDGTFYLRGLHRISRNFTLTVNFGDGDQAGTIATSFRYSDSSVSLKGNFDSNGVIRGDTTIYNNAIRTDNSLTRLSGTLHGLIGQEGAIGIFISNPNIAVRYSGGFVARPPDE